MYSLQLETNSVLDFLLTKLVIEKLPRCRIKLTGPSRLNGHQRKMGPTSSSDSPIELRLLINRAHKLAESANNYRQQQAIVFTIEELSVAGARHQ
jgi:hypothetical protein